jgi:long-chain acyl-CoA synthetase
VNLAAWLQRAGRSHPEQPAIAVGDRVALTYAQLAARCAGLAGALRSRYGLGPGDRVAVVARNDPAYIEALFGIWWAGLVAVPINAKLHAAEIVWILEHAEASLAFVSADVPRSLGSVPVHELRSRRYESLVGHDAAALVPRRGDDLAWLFYTSGTTGRPKGAMLTHRNLIAMSLAYLAQVDATAPGDALLHVAPMSHGSGLYSLPHVARAAVNVVPESAGFDAAEALELIRRWPATSLFAPPTIIRRMVDCADEVDTRHLRTLVWGGAPMHMTDTVRALERFGPCLAQIYGQGETPMTISVLAKRDVADRSHPRWRERVASAGVPNCAVEVRVGDPGEAELSVGELGEIHVRGDTVMAGYWHDAEATTEAVSGGWLHTGDIGAFDDDGYLTLRDRSKDLIITGGSNVYPREVEEVLASHPAVCEVAVIGRPDPEWGEAVVAYVVGEADAGELDRLCLGAIARFKRPKEYVFLPALPRNSYGKVIKTELRERDARR